MDEQSRCPETPDMLPGTQVTALQQMVNLLQSERDALAKELTAARSVVSEDQTIHPVVKKQVVSRQASRRDALGPIPPHDVTNWLEDRQADFQEALTHGDVRTLPELSRMLSDGARHLAELCPHQPSSVSNIVKETIVFTNAGIWDAELVRHPTQVQYKLDRQGGQRTIK